MPSTKTLLSRLKADYPQFSFSRGDDFLWSSSENTIYYGNKVNDQPIFLLHELSHALLGHNNYNSDIQLITMERQAWDSTIKLATAYGVAVTDDIIQANLDSYRDWMHSRSTCPNCQATGLQVKEKTYSCPACNHKWLVNDAKMCALRRYNVQT